MWSSITGVNLDCSRLAGEKNDEDLFGIQQRCWLCDLHLTSLPKNVSQFVIATARVSQVSFGSGMDQNARGKQMLQQSHGWQAEKERDSFLP